MAQKMAWTGLGGTVALGLVLAGCAAQQMGGPSGKQLYLQNCASCHGESGRGDGPLADGLDRRPADLTRKPDIGEPFPTAHIMGYVHGYNRRDAPDEVMPQFGEDFEGQTVLYDIGDGILTPTPLPLIKVAEYVRTLQDEGGAEETPEP
ncbi:Cytochrome C oxidase, cbb3-type, subunit III [Tranquillimonas rosea]|uniref:Cytochrome C oxidase, cbb3-type, subunit III n=1 Tax=Tranquillimonas rosea TaxID=641238 RepID=A0A1H9QXN9_9RHOB|nr:c-type cytochrome [Tranquillimonas rosea]SER64995.1 Cytochrome C oxidase, cbb3-type, subunit III [Tranquillimonas rosea]